MTDLKWLTHLASAETIGTVARIAVSVQLKLGGDLLQELVRNTRAYNDGASRAVVRLVEVLGQDFECLLALGVEERVLISVTALERDVVGKATLLQLVKPMIE